MDVRRGAAVTGLALGLALGPTAGWADEPTPDPGCTTYPVDGSEGGGEATAEPAPVEETPVVEEPAPEETEVPPAEGEDPPVEATEEPPVEATEEPEPSTDPSVSPTEEPGPEPSEYTVCLSAAEGGVGEDTSTFTGGGGAPESAAQLPRTGAVSVDLVVLGSGLVLLGAGAVVAGRRGRHT